MLACLDSFYEAVEARILTVNPARQCMGLSEAQDWPPQDVIFEAFYCLVLGAAPLGKQAYSAVSPFMVHHVQWVWLIMGSDVANGIRGRNRGDRYRTNHTMEQELLAGLVPYFAPKLQWSSDLNGNISGAPFLPSDPQVPAGAISQDTIWWAPPAITTRVDQASGLVYSSAAVAVHEITEQIAA